MNKLFASFASKAADFTGSSWAFLAAVLIILAWAVSGPVFAFSEVWQLVINTGTTIITFLMVFLIQNTQNRDSKALHIKINEIIHVLGPAHDELIDAEELSDEELRDLLKVYRRVARVKHSHGDMEEAVTHGKAAEAALDAG
jgi:low affinity Fe/Cu permease